MKGSNPDKPPPLGEKVKPQEGHTTTEQWRPIPGKPGFFVNQKGQMRYVPPSN